MKIALILGVTGQDGSYLSKLLFEKGYKVIGTTRDLVNSNKRNLKYLQIENSIELIELRELDFENIKKTIRKYRPDEIYNLGAQSSVAYSFRNPIETISYNIISVLYLLETIKHENPHSKFYQASSSEMFGNLAKTNLPLKESLVFHPASPYGVSKATAHWLSVNYREANNIFASCGILFNHESVLRGPNYVIKKIINSAVKIEMGLISEPIQVGNIQIERDWGYAPKYVEAMWKMLQLDYPDDFLICSGNIISLEKFIEYIFLKLKLDKEKYIKIDKNLYRPVDLMKIYGDNSKAKNNLGWEYSLSNEELIDQLIIDEYNYIQWDLSNS